MNSKLRGALFLDRDGTIIVDEHYLNDPARVKLLPGAASAISAANRLNVPVIVITNQSGIGRGLISAEQYAAVAKRVHEVLAAHDARIDATYYCAQTPEYNGDDCCRKPGLFMYRQAASAHELDLHRSAYIGDKWRDVEPALSMGGFGVLVPTSGTAVEDVERAVLGAHTAPDVEAAVAAALVWIGAAA